MVTILVILILLITCVIAFVGISVIQQIQIDKKFGKFLVIYLRANNFAENKEAITEFLYIDFEKLKLAFYHMYKTRPVVFKKEIFIEKVAQEYLDVKDSRKWAKMLMRDLAQDLAEQNIQHKLNPDLSPLEDFKNFTLKYLETLNISKDSRLCRKYLEDKLGLIEMYYRSTYQKTPKINEDKMVKEITKKYCANPAPD